MTTSDDVFSTLIGKLQADPSKPAGLTVAPFPMLNLDESELPYLGLRLTEGERGTNEGEDMGGGSERTCVLQVEIWAKGANPLAVTKSIREWLLGVVFADETLGGLAMRAEFSGYQADVGLDGAAWIGLAVLGFTYTYDWRP